MAESLCYHNADLWDCGDESFVSSRVEDGLQEAVINILDCNLLLGGRPRILTVRLLAKELIPVGCSFTKKGSFMITLFSCLRTITLLMSCSIFSWCLRCLSLSSILASMGLAPFSKGVHALKGLESVFRGERGKRG